MDYKNNYERWLKYSSLYKNINTELLKISKNEDEMKLRFSTDLKFGTAGLRGIMGVGTDRLNIFTIRKTTQGLSNYLKEKYLNPIVAISFDSRINSNLFAQEAAQVLAANEIKVYITKELSPTPFLSFAVRTLKCHAGIMITASHNPAEYNGYKCYSEDGAQMDTEHTEKIYNYIKDVDIFDDVKTSNFDKSLKEGLIEFIDQKTYKLYINSALSQLINSAYPEKYPISVTYTPLNGAGKKLVTQILNKVGINKLYIVKEQEKPDGNFTTCSYPNPENKETFKLALENANINKSDIVIATDPDSDRLGTAVLHNGSYQLLTGNELGILLFHYILSQKKSQNNLPDNCTAIRTIVSSKMTDIIAEKYNCKIVCVPTGFKYIGKEIKILEQDNSEDSFIFGFEESNGYLIGTYTRDKDAVSAAMLTCEMTSFYKEKGYSLIDVLNDLKLKYGFYFEKTLHFKFDPDRGTKIISSIMNHFRFKKLKSIGQQEIITIDDYLDSKSYKPKTGESINFDFPKLDIINFSLSGGSSIIIRPSGTEPKLKVYISTTSETEQTSKNMLETIELEIKFQIEQLSKTFK